ncbi:hypothetical protein BC835DRAFT_1338057 [Cytidiella melzeri]|nr:hypothetical protein BC835DRAFT_1338057 [Cytidiella melzeri]
MQTCACKDEASNKRQKQGPPGPPTAPQAGPSQPQPQAGPSAPRRDTESRQEARKAWRENIQRLPLSERQRYDMSQLSVAQQRAVLQAGLERGSQPRPSFEATLDALPKEEHDRLLNTVGMRLLIGDNSVPTNPLEEAMYLTLQADRASIRQFLPKPK